PRAVADQVLRLRVRGLRRRILTLARGRRGGGVPVAGRGGAGGLGVTGDLLTDGHVGLFGGRGRAAGGVALEQRGACRHLGAADVAGQLDRGLGGLDLDHRVVDGDGVAYRDLDVDDLGLGQALTGVGEFDLDDRR